MNRTKLTLSLVLIGVVVLFTLQNTQVVEVRFLFWKLGMSRVLLIFLLLAVGAVLGWVANGAYRHRARR
jgi:putative membrane protein